MPTKWIFGLGSLNELGEQSLPGDKAMVIISGGNSAKENGAVYRVMEQLVRCKVKSALYDKIEANPLKMTVMDGAAFAKINECDFIVAKEHRVLVKYFRLSLKKDNIERKQIYLRGHTDGYAYLKKIGAV